jgi:hypothetical protein
LIMTMTNRHKLVAASAAFTCSNGQSRANSAAERTGAPTALEQTSFSCFGRADPGASAVLRGLAASLLCSRTRPVEG